MAGETVVTTIRLSKKLRTALEAAAKDAGQSLAREIADRLGHSFDVGDIQDVVRQEIQAGFAAQHGGSELSVAGRRTAEHLMGLIEGQAQDAAKAAAEAAYKGAVS